MRMTYVCFIDSKWERLRSGGASGISLKAVASMAAAIGRTASNAQSASIGRTASIARTASGEANRALEHVSTDLPSDAGS